MESSWSFGPRKRSHKSKIVGAVIGLVVSASLVAVAAWLVVPDSPGFGYGKGATPENALQLTSMELLDGNLTASNVFAPGTSGQLKTVWQNPNPFDVTITRVFVPAGSEIQAVGNPSCSTTAFTVGETTGNFVANANNSGGATITLPLTAGANFPICLADARFRLAVVAQSVTTGS